MSTVMPPSQAERQSSLTFFRQSGWMVIATTLSGIFMMLVHPLMTNNVKGSEYTVLGQMLALLNLMTIPGIALQVLFAQQSAAALSPRQQAQLHQTVRSVLWWIFVIWVLSASALFFWIRSQGALPPKAIWPTIFVGLIMLWSPIHMGLLQGKQNFLWLGFASIINGCGRFVALLVIIYLFSGKAAGAMVAAFIGSGVALAAGYWQNRALFGQAREPMDWQRWLKRALPLTLGMGASQFMFTIDLLVVTSIYPADDMTAGYTGAGTIARALVLFAGPIMTVMFPKIVRNLAQQENSNLMAQALGATALVGSLAALFCTFFPAFPLKILKPAFVSFSPLLPWFVWSMLPLTLANVLISNLLARERFAVVPWLVCIALGYLGVLFYLSPRLVAGEQMLAFIRVVQTLGVAGLLLLAAAAWFTWIRK